MYWIGSLCLLVLSTVLLFSAPFVGDPPSDWVMGVTACAGMSVGFFMIALLTISSVAHAVLLLKEQTSDNTPDGDDD